MAKSFLLTIRADDGSTMLQTNVDYMHQAFQRLIDWSIDEVDHDVCAVISGPKWVLRESPNQSLTGFRLDRRGESEFRSLRLIAALECVDCQNCYF
jgi:hypothetical protein